MDKYRYDQWLRSLHFLIPRSEKDIKKRKKLIEENLKKLTENRK